MGAEEGEDDELDDPNGEDAGRCGGGDAGRGGCGGEAGLGAIGGGIVGRGIDVIAGAFGAALRAAFLRAGFAFFAVLRFAAARPRFAPFLARLLVRDAAERRRVVLLDFPRAAFLRPDRFDFDRVRAIKPPVSGIRYDDRRIGDVSLACKKTTGS